MTGKIAYDAYRNHTGGISLASGQNIPGWEDLHAPIRAAWEAAAKAVVFDHINAGHLHELLDEGLAFLRKLNRLADGFIEELDAEKTTPEEGKQ